MIEDSSWRPQALQRDFVWRNRYDLESTTPEIVYYEWCYALLVLQARNDDGERRVSNTSRTRHLIAHKFGKCWPIFKIFSPKDSVDIV